MAELSGNKRKQSKLKGKFNHPHNLDRDWVLWNLWKHQWLWWDTKDTYDQFYQQ